MYSAVDSDTIQLVSAGGGDRLRARETLVQFERLKKRNKDTLDTCFVVKAE